MAAYLSFTISHELFESASQRLIRDASELVAKALRVTQSRIFVSVGHATMVFGGSSEPSAFVELRCPDGLDANVQAILAKKLCSLLQREVEIRPERVYLNFAEVARSSWGWKGSTL